jgi:hypothetical protein
VDQVADRAVAPDRGPTLSGYCSRLAVIVMVGDALSGG